LGISLPFGIYGFFFSLLGTNSVTSKQKEISVNETEERPTNRRLALPALPAWRVIGQQKFVGEKKDKHDAES
jgi:hypothetical protein